MTGRNVVVTGAGSGIGRATAKLFAENGDRVSCWDIQQSTADETVAAIREQGGEAEAIQCDVSNERHVVSAFERVDALWGGLDVLFVNAGVEGPLKRIADVSLSEFNQVIGINLVGAFLISKHGVPLLQKNGGGAIVMTASVLAHVSTPDWGAYGVSKAGLRALARSLAIEHAQDGIRVNCVAPDGVSTELMHRGLLTTGLEEDVATEYEATLSTPEQVADVVYFLAGPGAALISGSSLLLDRGLISRRPS
ncbi:SDR family NAD(P)-dependent oxidoreductase [Salinibacterium sp. ZJ450]|uniref:SDR family NAD(P)-dependent oxidoreductase n=1 Tax=Salinibacterium sp. ZJ450 TaxID=2708338 RepID=UPI00141E81BE|nr:SDR family oxidoreductase [Salinibacterium sp. ZJ450]